MAEQVPVSDAYPTCTSASMTAPQYAAPAADAAITTMDMEQTTIQYSWGNPVIEVVERIARIVFIVILITYVGLAIAVVARTSSREVVYEYYDYDDDDYYDENIPFLLPLIIIVILAVSTCCTIGALLCDIPVMIAHFITNKVLSSIIFRILDIAKWIALTILYVIVFTIIEVLIELFGYYIYSPGPVIITCLVFCCIIIVMGVTMAVWDCVHIFVTRTTTLSSSQIVPTVSDNSAITTVI